MLNVQNPEDWEALFHEWCETGLDIKVFLKHKKMPVNSMLARKKTKHWEEAKRQRSMTPADVAKELDRFPILESKKDIESLSPEIAIKQIKSSAGEKVETAIHDIWGVISQWRHKQSEADYKLADAIRTHCKLILKESLIITPSSTGQSDVKTGISAKDLLQLASIAEKIQRIQRLALGLSTENVGIDTVRETIENDIPVFEVQMNSQGKFTKIR